jgi:hypothetical protein
MLTKRSDQGERVVEGAAAVQHGTPPSVRTCRAEAPVVGASRPGDQRAGEKLRPQQRHASDRQAVVVKED